MMLVILTGESFAATLFQGGYFRTARLLLKVFRHCDGVVVLVLGAG